MRTMLATRYIRDFIVDADQIQTTISEGEYCRMQIFD